MKKDIKPESEVKDNSIQLHFGNIKLIEIKLLETINKQLSEILAIMKEQGKK